MKYRTQIGDVRCRLERQQSDDVCALISRTTDISVLLVLLLQAIHWYRGDMVRLHNMSSMASVIAAVALLFHGLGYLGRCGKSGRFWQPKEEV